MNTATPFRIPLRLSASLLLAGQLGYIAVTQLHAGGSANDHHAIFAAYAGNHIWIAVHAGQFASVAAMLAGLVALCFSLNVRTAAAWLALRLGAATAGAALALYGMLQAIDGIALKHAVDAWVTAPDAEKAARFASAEAVRWAEWGVRSYQDFAQGMALLLLAAAATRAAGVPRPAAWLIGGSGLACLAQGWAVGTEGFTTAHSAVIVLTWVLSLAWMTWLAIIDPARHEQDLPA